MNLDLTILGWVHSVACTAALVLGAYMLLAPKGTPRHKAIGRTYVPVMIVVCLTSLGIYETGRWFFPHTLAVVTLGILVLGWLAARFKQPRGLWIHIHLSAMIVSYYMLIGGGVNEVFLRVDVLRALFGPTDGMPGRLILGMTHMVFMLVFGIWLIVANIATAMAGHWRRLAAAVGDPQGSASQARRTA